MLKAVKIVPNPQSLIKASSIQNYFLKSPRFHRETCYCGEKPYIQDPTEKAVAVYPGEEMAEHQKVD